MLRALHTSCVLKIDLLTATKRICGRGVQRVDGECSGLTTATFIRECSGLTTATFSSSHVYAPCPAA